MEGSQGSWKGSIGKELPPGFKAHFSQSSDGLDVCEGKNNIKRYGKRCRFFSLESCLDLFRSSAKKAHGGCYPWKKRGHFSWLLFFFLGCLDATYL